MIRLEERQRTQPLCKLRKAGPNRHEGAAPVALSSTAVGCVGRGKAAEQQRGCPSGTVVGVVGHDQNAPQ